MGVSSQLHALAALHQEKSPPYLLNRKLSEDQNRSGRSGEKKKIPSLHPPAIDNISNRFAAVENLNDDDDDGLNRA
jgi:hypothetical protein